MILIQLSPEDLRSIIREEMARLTEDDTVTRSQAAKLLRVSVGTVANMEKRGTLQRTELTGHPKYRRSAVIKLMK